MSASERAHTVDVAHAGDGPLPLHVTFFLNHLVRSRQHFRRNRQADLLRRLQVDDELELARLLHWQVGRRPTLEDLVNERCRTMVLGLRRVRRDETSKFDKIRPLAH